MSPPCHFYSILPFTESCIQLALGVIQNIKSLILTWTIKYTLSLLLCKVYSIDPFFYIFVCVQISTMFHIHKTYNPNSLFIFTRLNSSLVGNIGRSLMQSIKSSNKLWTFRGKYYWHFFFSFFITIFTFLFGFFLTLFSLFPL